MMCVSACSGGGCVKLLRHQPLGYEAHYSVAGSSDGHVLLGRDDPCRLVLLNYTWGTYQPVWQKPCPHGVSYYDWTEITGECTHVYTTPRVSTSMCCKNPAFPVYSIMTTSSVKICTHCCNRSKGTRRTSVNRHVCLK